MKVVLCLLGIAILAWIGSSILSFFSVIAKGAIVL